MVDFKNIVNTGKDAGKGIVDVGNIAKKIVTDLGKIMERGIKDLPNQVMKNVLGPAWDWLRKVWGWLKYICSVVCCLCVASSCVSLGIPQMVMSTVRSLRSGNAVQSTY